MEDSKDLKKIVKERKTQEMIDREIDKALRKGTHRNTTHF